MRVNRKLLFAALGISLIMNAVPAAAERLRAEGYHGARSEQHRGHRNDFRHYRNRVYKEPRYKAHHRHKHAHNYQKHHIYRHDRYYRNHYPRRHVYRYKPYYNGYWRAYHRGYKQGYRHRYHGNHHYYYNKHGFYFPGYGYIAHGHAHGDHCPSWHNEGFAAGLVLGTIIGH